MKISIHITFYIEDIKNKKKLQNFNKVLNSFLGISKNTYIFIHTNNFNRAKKYIQNLNVGTVNIWEVPGYRTEMSPFGGIKDSGLGYKEGVIEAMKSYTNVKTYSLPW